MSKIILVRHAQASLGKQNYDALSDKGFTQSKLLGQYFAKSNQAPSVVISGDLNRHQQTAREIIKALPENPLLELNPDWNEFNFKKLIYLYLEKYPNDSPTPGNIRAFFSVLKKSMLAWSEDKLDHEAHKLESWRGFSDRIMRAISSTPHNDDNNRPILVVSSGGAIAILLMNILKTSPHVMIDMNFQIRNTSFTELIKKPHKLNLAAFNQINHLDNNKDKDLITFA